MLTFIFTVLLVAAISAYMVVGALRTKRLLSRSCTSMIEKMRYVNYADVCFIARQSKHTLSPQEMIDRLGGADGVERMRINASIILEVSRYLNLIDPEGGCLAVQIQRDAKQLRWIAWTLRFQQRLGIKQLGMPESVQELCCLYVKTTVKHLQLCDRLVGDLLDLTQVMSSTQANIMRAHLTEREV